ncbi:MAG: HAD-IIIA family hydrolase [Aureibaculum sp.]|jgi:3-deoxy-D-manno-octulosonate 8-phosphate phosphatase (KDO 8-P phosphatase)
MGKSYKELMPKITTFIFDVDGVLTDGNVTVFPDGQLIRKMHIKDGYALKTAKENGYNVCIISGGTNEAVRSRLKNLGITDIYLGVHNKIEQLNEYLDIYDINLQEVLYMGDDLPDFHVMKTVGLAACPKDAVQEIQDISIYISQKKGGNGCVRDVIEQVMKVQDKWIPSFDAKLD